MGRASVTGSTEMLLVTADQIYRADFLAAAKKRESRLWLLTLPSIILGIYNDPE